MYGSIESSVYLCIINWHMQIVSNANYWLTLQGLCPAKIEILNDSWTKKLLPALHNQFACFFSLIVMLFLFIQLYNKHIKLRF